MSLAFAVRSLSLVQGSHCYSQASGSLPRAQALTRQITNAKGKVIIIQNSRSGEVDHMNIEDSCRLFLSKVALLNTTLPVHCCCDGWGEESASSSGFAWERRRASLSQRGPTSCWPPVRHLSANLFILTPLLSIFIMRFSSTFALLLQFTSYVFRRAVRVLIMLKLLKTGRKSNDA